MHCSTGFPCPPDAKRGSLLVLDAANGDGKKVPSPKVKAARRAGESCAGSIEVHGAEHGGKFGEVV